MSIWIAMPSKQVPSPTRRADAQHNREDPGAARTAFADSGAEVSMAEISRRAGVGMATLYRNFRGRRELLEALYQDEVDAVCEAATVLTVRHQRRCLTPGCAGSSPLRSASTTSPRSCLRGRTATTLSSARAAPGAGRRSTAPRCRTAGP